VTSLAEPRTSAGSVSIRLATDADSAALCETFAGITMDADLQLSIRRDPDFMALYRMQTDSWECWVGERAGKIVGLGALLARDGYLNGAPVRIGYLGDLRVAPRLPGGLRLLGQLYGPVLDRFAESNGCDLFLTTIIASNARALRALTSDRSRQIGIPSYHLLQQFDIRAVHLALPRLRAKGRYEVRRASEPDLPTIAAFLDADSRRRPFGYVLDEPELRRRLARWPGLEISDFYLAFDWRGALVGCCAPWDASPVKRTVVTAYRGSMRWVRRVHDVAAPLLGVPALPSGGQALKYAYLTHLAVPSGEPAIMRALLEAVYRDRRAEGFHFLSVCVPESDPLRPAYSGFLASNLRSNLYVVAARGQAPPHVDLTGRRPGFEMALV
jgi:hypothetical protein